ncbi:MULTISPECIES: nuclear transport factor 2 family protein [Rhodomicrobium]|uniref:nuclear transport factor 2 family protein n=1 Tax=Rhodomicrobium TaxID=1068 RepID=UPI000B4A6496|nr:MULTISPECIES: nuclear transport factor 2 family protein [Rhodomicrobium]
MAIKLPKAIEIFFTSGQDVAAFDRCFTADAVVRDEHKTHQGLAAIKAWRKETLEKYQFTAEPVALSEKDGKTVVTAKLSGNFPGSPIELDHSFELAGDRIAALEIG